MGAGRCGNGGGGGGIHGAVTATLDGGGGAARVAVVGGTTFTLEIGGDGGLATGGLSTRPVAVRGCAISCRQSCDWCRDDGVGTRTGDDRGSLMLCALDTLALLVRFSFLGGGDGFCTEGDTAAVGLLGTIIDFATPLPSVAWPSDMVDAESVVL